MMQHNTTKRSGFSLIELIVVIGIIALLITIALPTLGSALSTAKQTKSLANIRSVHGQFEQWSGENGHHPFRTPGEMTDGERLTRGPFAQALFIRWWKGSSIATTSFFSLESMWPAIIEPNPLDWPQQYESWISPGRPTELPTQEELQEDDDAANSLDLISIRYSNSFVARPETWNAKEFGTIGRTGALRPTRPDEVRFPSGKVMLWDAHLAYLRRPWPEFRDGHYDAPTPMGFADGHGDVKNPLEASDPVDNPLNDEWPEKTLSDTKDGIYGIDY